MYPSIPNRHVISVSVKSDEYSDKSEERELPEEVRLLIDRYVSEQPISGCSSTCLDFPTVKRCFLKNVCMRNRNRCPEKVKLNSKSRKKDLKAIFFRFLTHIKTIVLYYPLCLFSPSCPTNTANFQLSAVLSRQTKRILIIIFSFLKMPESAVSRQFNNSALYQYRCCEVHRNTNFNTIQRCP